ncbi:glycolate oxidase FAD binding subunit [Marinobacter daqiaonensis]|uniref:Glycolate oxidase FAD binding subunit n=1 Tax=Marinobacter daqiaonensis TaxID=650891 RepID=A0A1I6HTN4_9GAMM|nr:glycolate oxidase subunit GlcE [Marinobacter daqiaonensis]SFR57793.1 glycolate oxidase FAD binding subunit [Marinobacter daqiaonensis]
MADITGRLQEQILAARDEKRKLRIVGGGSKAFMGRQVNADDLHVGEHSGIVEYQPVELVLTARAGTLLTDIEAALAENNQMMSFEPPRFTDKATIGGTLACNQSGPGRPWTSSVRDQVLGTRVINGKGEHLRFGGQVMKNVAGYDVSRLQAGAMGTLGLITEISLKVLPRPAATATLVSELPLVDAIEVMNRRAAEPKPLTGACWLDGKLYLRLSGARSAVDATARQWQGELLEDGDRFWAELRDHTSDFFAGDEPLWRFSVNPTAANPDIKGDWLVDWGGAQRWYRGEAQLSGMEALAVQAGGQVSLFRGGDRSGEVMHRQPAPLKAVQQRLKHAFDPDAIFNPGRLYTWM